MEQQSTNEKILVIALFNFKPQNTDELVFNKNDVIILTQAPIEGGWWEGTLNGKTGWFPSNYVEQIVKKTDSTSSSQNISLQQYVDMYEHRETIIETFIENEKHYISELEDFVLKIIQPLALIFSTSNQSSPSFQLNIDELIKFHHHLSQVLINSIKTQHRIGGIFLQLASIFKPIFEVYCSQHAKTIFLFNNNKDEILDPLLRINSPNDNHNTYQQIIKNLSLPITHLEKYVSFLNEYFYNLEEYHMDRGDTQRAIEYYTELISFGSERRKRKEWELDIIHSTIHGLDCESLISFGDALCLSPVNILLENNINQILFERIAILYSSNLFLLSISSDQKEYYLQNRFPINQITISKILDKTKHALKINVPLNQSIIILFPSSIEYNEWCEKLSSLLRIKSPISQQILKSISSMPKNTENLSSKLPIKNLIWSKGCLRPHSPLRFPSSTTSRINSPILSSNINTSDTNESGSNRTLKRIISLKKSKPIELLKRVETSEGDSILLSVIEAYCVPNNNNKTTITNLNNLVSKTTPTNIPNIDIERRTIYNMLNELRLAYKSLQQEFEEEKRARKQLESQIQKLFIFISEK